MTARYVDIENEVLRDRLQEQRSAVTDLCRALRRYLRGECLRSELVNTLARAEEAVRGESRAQPRTRTD